MPPEETEKSRRVTIYLAPEIARLLRRPPDETREWSLSGRIADMISRYDWVVSMSMPTLTRAEWCAFLDANNGTASLAWMEGGNLHWGLCWANVADSPELAEKWGVDRPRLIDRLRSMTPAEQIAMLEVLERFWARPGMDTDAALAEAGAKIAPAP